MTTHKNPVTHTTLAKIIGNYDALLIDAFGVLVRGDGLLPGALDFMAHLHKTAQPYLILTNDASRLPSQSNQWYQSLGLQIDTERIVTSGSLLTPHFTKHNLKGAPTIVLGPEGSQAYAKDAGAHIVAPDDDAAEVIAVCDDAGYPFLETIEATLSTLLRRTDGGKNTHLILPNPDLIYPRSATEVGLTSGAVALIFEEALKLRYPQRTDLPAFARLGKPHNPIFEAAVDKLRTRNVLMIGDQLQTDILGANNFGIDSALVTHGLTQWDERAHIRPTFLASTPLM